MIKVFTTCDWTSDTHTTMIYNEEGHKIFQNNEKFEANFYTVYMFGGKLYTLESIKDEGKYFIFDDYDLHVKGLVSGKEIKIK
ncbi:hypothetical protein CHOTACABRAS_147 [Bacillus phage Chotacabras]|nr:hypothetical protein CHOTACABRAS_147 [Bacillus phage Chotacabras]